MSIDINLKQPEAGTPGRGRGVGAIAVLLAGVFLVGAAVVGQVLRDKYPPASLPGRLPTATLAEVIPEPTATNTAPALATATAPATLTATLTATTVAATQSPGLTQTQLPAAAGSPTIGLKQTGTPATAQPTVRASQTVTGTVRLGPTATPTRTATSTRVPPTATRTRTPTRTRVPPTATRTPSPTRTATPARATSTPSPTAQTVAPAPTIAPVTAAGAQTWYFAEGSTASPNRTSYSIVNPGTQPATVTLLLYPETGSSAQRTISVAPGVRVLVEANTILPNASFGAAVRSEQTVYVERLTVGERDGVAASAQSPSRVWYFPEGQTDDDFTTWLRLLNPGRATANVLVSYLQVGSPVVTRTVAVKPLTRVTVAAHKDLPVSIMGMTVESDQPIVAEYAVYFDSQKAAYGGPGLPALSKTWYVAGGNTQEGFVTRLALLNPGNATAQIRATFLANSPAKQTDTYTLTARTKDDIVLNDRADGQVVAVILESDQPIAAETVTYYFSSAETGPVAAYSAPALAAPALEWYLPASSSAPAYDDYIMLFTPGQAASNVTAVYFTDSGEAIAKSYDMPAGSRLTLRLADEVTGKVVVAAKVSGTQPLVAAHVTMFRGAVGAAASSGIVGR